MSENTTSSQRVRVGVIGVGFAGEVALRGLQKLTNVDIVALAGLEEDRLASLSQTFAVPHLYREYEELLQRDDLDAVTIGVPNFLHAPVAVAALERGLHVLCEKPLARTGEEAQRIVDAARNANRVLQVVFNYRERADVQTLKRYIDDGQLGDIYYAKASWTRRRGIPGAGSWFVNKNLSGGGPFIDLGIHILDMSLYLMQEPQVVAASAATYNQLATLGLGYDAGANKSGAGNTFSVEDLGTAFLRLANGATLLLEASWALHGGAQDDMTVALYGTKGGAIIHSQNYASDNTLTIYTDVAGVPSEVHPQTHGGTFHDGVVRTFIEKIASGNWTQEDAAEGLHRARILDACYLSAAEGREVRLDVE